MDLAKVRFLFGKIPTEIDVDDQQARELLLAPAGEEDRETRFRGTLRAILGNQIADDNPPETWLTAQRLLKLGMPREQVMGQLALTFSTQLTAALEDKTPYDAEKYLAALARLPLPTLDEVQEAYIQLVRDRQPIPAADLKLDIAAQFGREADDQILSRLLDEASDRLVDENVVEFLFEDRIVHPASLTAGITLTHRLSAGEISGDLIEVIGDLGAFACHKEVSLSDGHEVCSDDGFDNTYWVMPPGWMEKFAENQLLAATVQEGGTAQVRPLANAPVDDPKLVARLRRIYDQEAAEDDMPVPLADIVYELLVEDRTTFSDPRPPLQDLCREAGLELRGTMVAHDDQSWENLRKFQLSVRGGVAFNLDYKLADAAVKIVELATRPNPTPADLKLALTNLTDPKVGEFVVDELVSSGEELTTAQEFAGALIRAAGEGRPKAVAHWFAALIAEHAEEAVVAEAHLHVALASGRDWEPVLERAAWYASDRGDAPGAISLLRRLRNPPEEALATFAPFTIAQGRELGRNEPCWCGSGRKFKQCHLNRPAASALPDRVSWLCFKAVSYVEHHREALDEALELAELRAADPDDQDSMAEAIMDPLIMDLVLTEGGWFEEFLEQRGRLLPQDEALLAGSWTLVDRSVYQVEVVRPGVGVTVKNLASGESLQVRERTFSRQAQVGWMVCGRAVPDGESNQFVGGVFIVKPGQEEQVLDLCTEGDAYALASWAGALYRPPQMVTREKEELVSCTMIWKVADPASAREALDTSFEVREDGWVATYELGEDDVIIRAQLQLDEDLLTVSTASEERMDRVLTLLESTVEGELVSDERMPVLPGSGPPESGSGAEAPLELDPQMVNQIQEQMENRWMSEPVPALAGLTPRQAAADPTRREQLERLLANFDELAERAAGGITFRVDRLRRELGI